MQGEVVAYGKKGDPIVRPLDGGKTVVLEDYKVKPNIGTTVIYRISKKGKYNVHYGTLLINGCGTIEKIPEKCGIDSIIDDILDLWDQSFSKYEPSIQTENFQKSVFRIKGLYDDFEYETALKIAIVMYGWACDGAKNLKLPSGAGFPLMKGHVEDLGKKIVDAYKDSQQFVLKNG